MVVLIMRLVAGTVTILAVLASCGPTAHPKSARSLVLGEFEGVLPCADCAGLDTKLSLVESKPGAGAGTYIMSEDYIGKSSKPFESSGTWNTVEGTSRDPLATVYVLDPDMPRKTSYYALRGDGSLQLLDRERNEIDAPFDLSLKPRPVGLGKTGETPFWNRVAARRK